MVGDLHKRLTLAQVLVFFLALLPACYQGIVILRYGVNMPYMDDWSYVWLFQEASQGTHSFGDLMRQPIGAESRLFFPNLLVIGLAFLMNWDLRYEMMVTFLLACLTSFNVYHLGKLTIEGSRLKRLTIFLLSNLLIFAPIQAANWLWAFQFVVFIPIACITTSLVVAYSALGTKTKLLTCMALATISTFSCACGMAAWIVLFPVIAVIASSRTWGDSGRKVWLVLVWVTGFALNVAFYFYDYQETGIFTNYDKSLQPVALQYFLAFLGAPYSFGLPAALAFLLGAPYSFGPAELLGPPYIFGLPAYSHLTALTVDIATILGSVLLFFFVLSCGYLLRFRRNSALIHQALGWLMIAAYSIISGLLLAISGRLSAGVAGALTLRYPQFQLYLAVSLIHLIPLVFSDAVREGNPLRSRLFAVAFGSSLRRVSTVVFGSLVAIVLFLHLLTSYFAAQRIPAISVERSNSKVCLLLIDVVQNDKCLNDGVWVYSWSGGTDEFLRNNAHIANNLGFLTPGLVESDKIRDIEGAGSANYGNFDALTETDDDSYLANGWAIIPGKDKPADGVLLTYTDAQGEPTLFGVFGLADMGKERPDVVEALGSDAYLRSGWQGAFSSNAVPEYSTEIVAWAFDADAKRAFKLYGTYTLEK